MKNLKTKEFLQGLVFPECPRWKNDKLWFSNIFANQIIAVNEDGSVAKTLNIPAIGIDWLPDDTLIFVENNTRNQYLTKVENDDSYTPHSPELHNFSPFMFNDLVIDSRGFAYTGNVGCKAETLDDWKNISPGPILLVRRDGTAEIAAENLQCPNGLVITPDNKKLIVAESKGNKLTSFAIAADGSLYNRQIFAEFDDEHSPDGICLDEEGAVWVAAKSECLRVKEGGEITHAVTTLGTTSLACMLGGRKRTTLFVCTLDHANMDPLELNEKKTGRIEIVEVDTPPGAGMP